MQFLSSLLLVSTLVTGFVDAKPTAHKHVARQEVATRTTDDCDDGQFFWGIRGICLKHGGPDVTPKPPHGLACPDLWYFDFKEGCCMPRTKPLKSTTPTCSKDGFFWFPHTQCCSKKKPHPPSYPVPSGKPMSKFDKKKKSWHGEKKKNNNWHGGGFKNKNEWHHKEARDRDKIKRNFEQWDTSYCPSGLTACPSVSHGVLTGDTECIDTLSDLYSCGGCTSKGEGKDCSKIPGASCLGGVCVV